MTKWTRIKTLSADDEHLYCAIVEHTGHFGWQIKGKKSKLDWHSYSEYYGYDSIEAATAHGEAALRSSISDQLFASEGSQAIRVLRELGVPDTDWMFAQGGVDYDRIRQQIIEANL